MSLHDPRMPVLADHRAVEGSKPSAYQVVAYIPDRTTDGSAYYRATDRTFTLPGDHLHLIELQGSDTIAVGLGREGAFIPMREGDTLSRVFDQFRVRNTNYPVISAEFDYGSPARALFLVSTGAVLERRFKPSGFVPSFPIAQRTLAGNGGEDVFDQLTALNANYHPIGGPLRWGGTLALKNTGASTLFLYYGPPGEFDPLDGPTSVWTPTKRSWPIAPGETFVIDSDTSLRRTDGTPGSPGAGITSVCVAAALANLGSFALMLSRPALDISDWDTDALSGINKLPTEG